MEKKKGYALPIAILVVLIVYVVIYTGYVTLRQMQVQYSDYKWDRNMEQKQNLKPNTYSGKEFIPLNNEERRKYLNERKLKTDGEK